MIENQTNLFSPFVVFATGNGSNKSADTFEIYLQMERIPYKRLRGCWNGIAENSFLIPLEAFEQYHLRHPWTDGQEAILVLGSQEPSYGGRRPVAVEYGGEDGHWHTGGMFWTQVSAAEAKTQPGWTYDPETDTYWLVMNEGGEIVDLSAHDHEGAKAA